MATSDRPIPTLTACSATRFDRRAMRIASARASIRSTVRTTSAASEDAVAPRAASATPTPAAASAGASFTPSPTMIVAASRPRSRIAASLSAGSQSASTVSTPTIRPTVSAMSARSPVTRTTRLIPAVAQGTDHPRRVGPDRVLEQERAGGFAVDGDEHRERAVQVRATTHLPHPGGWGPADDPVGLAEPHLVAVRRGHAARSRAPRHVLRELQRQPAAVAPR